MPRGNGKTSRNRFQRAMLRDRKHKRQEGEGDNSYRSARDDRGNRQPEHNPQPAPPDGNLRQP